MVTVNAHAPTKSADISVKAFSLFSANLIFIFYPPRAPLEDWEEQRTGKGRAGLRGL
jgi:hypothetical protein